MSDENPNPSEEAARAEAERKRVEQERAESDRQAAAADAAADSDRRDAADRERAEQAEPDKTSAEERLRAFEDEHFGKDVARINGQIERGSGSAYHNAPPEIRQQYERYEHLALAEKNVVDKRAALIEAESDYQAVLDAIEQADKPHAEEPV